MRPGRHVLVVDDDSIQRRLVRTHLVAAGFTVSATSGATEALETARARTPDVILSDVVMSELDGFALCSVFRCDPALSGVPIILVTAQNIGEQDVTLARSMGAQALLQRSPDFQAELAALSAVFDAPSDAPAQPWRPEPGVRRMAAQMSRLLALSRATTDRDRVLLENGSDVVWTATADGERLLVTPNIQNLCGFTPGELLEPNRYNEQIHPDDAARVGQSFLELAVTGKPLDVEYRLRHKDGRWIWMRDRGVSSQAGGQLLVNGISTDISDRKQLEEEVRVCQKMEAIGQLTAGIAHDFNNTLAIILGNAELLRDALPEQDAKRADLDEILDASNSATALTRQLLAFSRRDVIEPRVIDLNESVVGVERLLRRLIGEDITLSSTLVDGFAAVCADPGEIEQIIMNLAVNARDAMPHGGTLAISTSHVSIDDAQARRLEIARGSYVALAVCDTGCGIDMSLAGKVFEPFFTTKEAGKGTGLGLATCRRIVTQRGGAIAVDSERGRGSRFTVLLPAAATEQVNDAPEPLMPGAAGGNETILLIEDDERVRIAIHRLLEKSGYEVLPAGNASEAIALARTRSNIDLVVTDVITGRISGPDIVRQITQECGPTKALFMSAYAIHAALSDQRLNMQGHFISKPFTAAALARKIREVLDDGRRARGVNTAPVPAATSRQITILLIEDDPALREFLRDMLLSQGYGVIDTSSADEASYLCDPVVHDIGLVVTDIRMPGTNGVTFVQQLRTQHPNLPVLFISGSAVPPSLPPCGFLRKPFRPFEFIDAVSGLVSGGRPIAASARRIAPDATMNNTARGRNRPPNPLMSQDATQLLMGR